MRRSVWWATISLAAALLPVGAGRAPAESIYFTSGAEGTISRLDLATLQITPNLVTGAGLANGIALDVPDGKMFWADGSGTIRSANLDGTGEMTLASGLPSPTVIALDVQAGKVFWTDAGGSPNSGDIRSANLDGSGQQSLVTGLTSPAGLAIDPATNRIYWADTGGIHRADLTGSNQQPFVSNTYAFAIAEDPSAGQLYWSGQGILRASLVGGAAVQVIPPEPSQLNDTGLALDLTGGLIYWADQQHIFSANLDGTGIITLFTGDNLYGIALDASSAPVPEPSSLILAVLGMAGMLRIFRVRRPLVPASD